MICKRMFKVTFTNEPELIFLHTVKWFQVLISDINSSMNTLLNAFKYCYLILIVQ